MRLRRQLLLVLAAGVASLVAADSAAAAFPGRDGEIAVGKSDNYASWIDAFPPVQVRDPARWGRGLAGVNSGDPAFSPRGRLLAFAGNGGLRIKRGDGRGRSRVVVREHSS